jgi:hypothetical protein
MFSAFVKRETALRYIAVAVTALLIVGEFIFRRTLFHVDKLTHHVMFYTLLAAGLVIQFTW